MRSLLAASLGAALAASTGPARAEIVDGTGDVGRSACLALDGSGNPHVAYLDATNGSLKYARQVGGAWLIETVTAAGTSVGQCALALDATGTPHVSFWDQTGSDLRLAMRGTGGWSVETIIATGDVGAASSIAIDPLGGIHVCAVDWTRDRLLYARRQGTAWSIEVADSATAAESTLCGFTALSDDQTSLRLDSDHRPHVAYVRACSWFEEVRVAARGAAGWTIETADASYLWGAPGLRPSLELDAGGRAHVSFGHVHANQGWIALASRGDPSWSSEQVEVLVNPYLAPPGPGRNTSLALDGAGRARVAYVVHTWLAGSDWRSELRLAAREEAGWELRPLDSGGNAGFYCSLALDAGGLISVAWYDAAAGDLKFWRGPAPPVAVLAPVGTGDDLRLSAPWPNPLRPGDAVHISCVLPRAEEVSLALEDVAGRVVRRQGLGVLGPGPVSLVWTPGRVASGVYHVRLKVGSRPAAARRLILIR